MSRDDNKPDTYCLEQSSTNWSAKRNSSLVSATRTSSSTKSRSKYLSIDWWQPQASTAETALGFLQIGEESPNSKSHFQHWIMVYFSWCLWDSFTSQNQFYAKWDVRKRIKPKWQTIENLIKKTSSRCPQNHRLWLKKENCRLKSSLALKEMKVTLKQEKYCYFHFLGSQAAPLNSTPFVPQHGLIHKTEGGESDSGEYKGKLAL